MDNGITSRHVISGLGTLHGHSAKRETTDIVLSIDMSVK